MWHPKLLCILYMIAVCAAQDLQTGPTPLPTTAFGPTPTPLPTTAFERPVPVLLNGKTSLEVFSTEKVELNCTIPDSSDWTFTWYNGGGKVESGPHFSLSEEGSVLTVTVQNGDTYSCEGLHKTKNFPSRHSNSLQLRFSGEIPKPNVTRSSDFNPMYPGEKITFTCTLEEPSGWEYLWYHNSIELPVVSKTYETVVSHNTAGKYHCKARRGKGPSFTQDSEPALLNVSEPPTPSLRLDTPWSDVFENEGVQFTCEMEELEWTFLWYRDKKKLQEDSVLILDEEGMLNITSVRRSDQGGYACKVQLESRGVVSEFSEVTTLTVYENLPKPTITNDPVLSQMYVGETVNFTCKVSVSTGWEYVWYRDEKKLHDSGDVSVRLGPSDGGSYWCKASRGRTTTAHSEKIQLDVLETPTPSLKPVTKWLDVFPTESVKFHCSLQGGGDWKYTWYKDSNQLHAGNSVSFDSNGATLSIQSASADHKGKYKCKGNLQNRPVGSNSSPQLTLTLYGKKPTLTVKQYPEYTVMYPGEAVSFTCDMDEIGNAPEWEYMWFKDDQLLRDSQKTYEMNLTGTADHGSYKCQAKRGTSEVFVTDFSQSVLLKVKGEKPKPSITLQPDVGQLYIGEPADFECKTEVPSEWNYSWLKDGKPLPTASSRLNIDSVSLSNGGVYVCKAKRIETEFFTEHSDERRLLISEIPVPTLKRETKWSDVFPNESVTFSCKMRLNSSIWTYVWYKDASEVQDQTVSLSDDQTNLSITSASVSHRGNYSCLGRLKSRAVPSRKSSPLMLHVYDKNPVVTLMQNPIHSLMHTEDSVSFSCHVNVSSGWDYLWSKNQKNILDASGNHLNISSVVTAHSGLYQCQVKRGPTLRFTSGNIKLDIKERPTSSIILQTGWSEVFSTDSLVLRCEVLGSEVDNWNYTWYKEEQLIELATSEIHIATPQNDPDQSYYKCNGVRSGRPSYSKLSSSFKTKNLLLKRRLLLSISGIIVFGIIAIFLGCIVCRVFRKPVENDEKPEEANLFLSMAQLKNLNNGPCPLVDYITDASLNETPKEGEGNGTISSETTPLPISLPEENGVMESEQDKAENNGGLLSFQS